VRKQVAAYVHSQLKARRIAATASGSKGMSHDECQRIENKVSAKVVEGSTSLDSNGGVGAEPSFLTSKRKEKIKSLIESYIAQGKGGGGGGKGSKPGK